MQDWDVIVTGGGSAGLIAAIAAADEGVKVLQLEKTAELGGCWGPGVANGCSSAGAQTILQFEAGIFHDSPSLFYAECMQNSEARKRMKPEILRFYCERAGIIVDWLYRIGAYSKRGQHTLGVGYGGSWTVPRIYYLNNDFSQLILARHWQRIARGDVELLVNTRVTSLIQDKSGIVGVAAEDESGSIREYRARSVVICTGGFGGDLKMMRTYNLPQVSTMVTIAPSYATGEGLIMCHNVGAQMVNLDVNTAFGILPRSLPDPDNPGRRLASLNMSGYPGAIWVNRWGQRVINEDCGFTSPRVIELKENIPGHTLIVLLDRRIVDENPPIVIGRSWQWFEEQATEGRIIKKADTVEELGQLLGIDGSILADTVTRYNGFVEAGVDVEFGRMELRYKIENPPFYAIQTATLVVYSRGGPVTNIYQQVLDEDNKLIPGLYAAGEVNGVQATGAGHLNMGCFIFGQQAGRMAARYSIYSDGT